MTHTSNVQLDPDEVDPNTRGVVEELQSDHAGLSYIESRLARITRAKSLVEAREEAEDLIKIIRGKRDALRGEMVRLRTPDG